MFVRSAAMCAAFVSVLAVAAAQPIVISEERGLSEPVPAELDLAAVNAQYVADVALAFNDIVSNNCPQGTPLPWSVSGGVLTAGETFFYDGPGNTLCGVGSSFPTILNGERRVVDTVIGSVIDNTIGSPGQFQLDAALAGGGSISVLADDLATARSDLLSTARSTGRRYFIAGETLTGGGPVQIVDRVVSRLLTGRDLIFVDTALLIGAAGQSLQPIGYVAQCPTSTSFVGCVGGASWDLPPGAVGATARMMTVLYISETVERTLTGGTSFYDVSLLPLPSGTAHAAAQTVGFAAGDRFLRRLVSPGAAGFGAPLGPSDEASRWRVFLEGTGARGELTGNDTYYFQALRGGLSRVISPNLDLGLAFEVGNWRYKHPDAFTPERGEGDLWRLGAFARYTPGPWRLHGAVIGGEQDVETIGFALLGGGTARSKMRARVLGAGGEVGYALPIDGLTLTPHARVTALQWSSPAVVESGNAGPLSVAKATREQVRFALGATLGKRYEIAPGLDLGVEIGARAFTVTGDTHGRVVATDTLAPTAFTIDGRAGERNGVELSAGLTLVKDGRMAIAASYEGRFAGDEQSHAGMLTLKMAF